jgi:RHS repeat-associated protein
VTGTSNGGSFVYDYNGNMTSRRLQTGGPTYTQTWDYDNRLASVTVPISGSEQTTTTFTYDGNGALVKKESGGETTVYVGSYYEKSVTTGQITKYYFFGAQRVAMNKAGVLYYIAGDHLGTTSVVLDASGNKVAESHHYPYGVERWSSGTLPTDYRFTGQRFEAELGIYVMGVRWYDPYINRFLSPDSIISQPANPQNLNRYSYVEGNPLRFVDSTGFYSEDEILKAFEVETWDEVLALFKKGGALEGLWGWLEILRQASDNDMVMFGVLESSETDGLSIGPLPENMGFFSRDEMGHILVNNKTALEFAYLLSLVVQTETGEQKDRRVTRPVPCARHPAQIVRFSGRSKCSYGSGKRARRLPWSANTRRPSV